MQTFLACVTLYFLTIKEYQHNNLHIWLVEAILLLSYINSQDNW